MKAVRSAARDLGVSGDEVVGVPYGSDLRHLVNAGATPGVLFGPGNVAGAHRPNESIAVSELVDGARAVALLVMRFLAAGSCASSARLRCGEGAGPFSHRPGPSIVSPETVPTIRS